MATASTDSKVANVPPEQPVELLGARILVDQPLAQRESTFTNLVRRHQAEIWRYLRFLGCENGQAEDLTQETFLAVLRHPPDDLGAAATRAYLRTAARNQFLTHLRRLERPQPVDLELAESVWAEAHAGDGGDAYLDALGECLQQLEGRAQTAIHMAYREGSSRAQIAAAMEMSEDGVKTLLRRTREILRECVERRVRTSSE
jgi:RNA polymerase sigma-70 factor, ECF subfamily